MARFQILSLVGGGIRGAFVTSYLDRLEQKLGRSIAESFDLIAGTSTGAIIAAGLAAGMSAGEVHQFYVRHGASIFTPRPKYQAKGLMRLLFPLADAAFRWKTGGDLSAAFRSKYCPSALEHAFAEGFGDLTMGDVDSTRLIIPAINLTLGRPQVFRSCHLPSGVHDRQVKVADAVIASSSAPTYFPHHQIGDNAYVDGGLWAADPSMLALAETMRIQQFEKRHESNPRYETNEVHLMSIGTGRTSFSWEPPGADAGLIYWAPRTADVMTTSQVEGIHMPLQFLLGDRYHHINFNMEQKWSLDDVGFMPQLFQKGEEVAEASFEEVRDQFFQHRRHQFVRFDEPEEAQPNSPPHAIKFPTWHSPASESLPQ